MTREQAIKLLEQMKECRFNNALIFYYSPVSEIVEERHIYADDYAEIHKWANERAKEYCELNFDFALYVNGGLQFASGYIWKD